jgi:hypothetical protein
MLDQIITSIHTRWIGLGIALRHQRVGPPRGIPNRLEEAVVDTLRTPGAGIHVHWGVYEIRQARSGGPAAGGGGLMLVHGHDLTYVRDPTSWLRLGMGVPEDPAGERWGSFLR